MRAARDRLGVATTRLLVIRLRLDDERRRVLEQVAEAAGIDVEQVAAVWLAERLTAEVESRAVVRAGAELRQIRGSLGRLTEDSDPLGEGGPANDAGKGGRRGRAARAAATTRESLHGEIVAVLREHGEPLSAAEIAEAIRRRGRYHPPRSGPLTGASVSRRIANPYYRALFERSGRRVALARGPQGDP
jgi:hypothetical protein